MQRKIGKGQSILVKYSRKHKKRKIYKLYPKTGGGDILSLEGVLANAENVEVFYLKETISFNKVQEGESVVWETAILYKFYVELDESCDLSIYLPFSLQGGIEWKQENMRSKDYQTKVAHVTGFESLGDDVFHIRFYEELGELTAIIPTDEEMRNIAIITSKQIGERISSRITISIPKPDSSKNSFSTGKFGFGFMFKVKTRNFLTRENMEKLNQPGQIWSFNIKTYPVTSSLTTEEQGRLINLHELDIWTILPEDATIFHLNPSPKTVMMMEEEDERLQNAYADIKGPYKTYKSGEIAIFWDLRDIRKEIIMNYIGLSPLGVERSDIGKIWAKINEMNNSMEKMNGQLELSTEKIENIENNLEPLREFPHFKERAITWDQLFAPLTLFLTFFTLIMALIFNIFLNLYQTDSGELREVGISPISLSLVLLVVFFVMFFYLVRKFIGKSNP